MLRIILVLFLFYQAFDVHAQAASLARKYYNDGEFEKAASLYKDLHEQNRANDYFFECYFTTLLELEDYTAAERMCKKAIKAAPDKIERYVSFGILYERQSNRDKANEQFEKGIKLLEPNQMQIVKLANAFIKNKNHDYAVETYQKGEKLLKTKHVFSFEMGSVYRLKGDVPNMIEQYLNCLDYMPSRLTNIQAFFQRELSPSDGFDELKKQLFQLINKNTEVAVYTEMLIWVYIQSSDYENALRHATALDKRLNENGYRIFNLAQTAMNEKAYKSGILAFDYLISKGLDCPYYVDAKQLILAAKRQQLTEGFTYTKEDLVALSQEYESFLDEFGRTYSSAGIMVELADFEALYINDLDKAIKILHEVIEMPNLNRTVVADYKIKLGDYYLMTGEVWESSLLYSQVDKAMKDAPLGDLARYKNAKLSYFKGDFEWAQEQLNVLKGSTSELVSNDAIDLAVFILDHYALDTSAKPMQGFAQVELLCFQHKFDVAIQKMDSLLEVESEHGLVDDILFAKANIAFQKRDYSGAVALLEKIPPMDTAGILVDNAIFRMAEIHELHLEDKQKAMELYEKILFDCPGSLFVVEARKRFRRLRGDGV